MIEIPDNPHELGVPHDDWRPNQRKMLEKIVNNDERFVFGELGTGSGKSCVVCALGHFDKVLVLVHTLALLTQYEQKYGFNVIRGRQEYPCANKEKIEAWRQYHQKTPTAADCTFSLMHKCPYSSECRYLIAKEIAFASDRMGCTYKYAALSSKIKERPGTLVCDEAHDSVEEIIGFNKFEYSHKYLRSYKLPPFPIESYGEDNQGGIIDELARITIEQWVDDCLQNLVITDKDTEEDAKRKRLYDNLGRITELLGRGYWYLKIDKESFVIQALNADNIANSIFKHKDKILLMSATIGNPEPLADALGIQEYEFHTFPHPIPPHNRPVDNLNVPRMTHRNLMRNPDLYRFQAERAWEWVSLFDPEWRGLILTTSYEKIENFYAYFSELCDGHRLIVQERGMSVGDVIEKFITDVRKGDIMIGTVQGMGTGLDLYGDLARWAVIAGVPHVNPTDNYMKTRRQIAGGIKYQYWMTYNAVTQAAGRITRGERTEDGGYLTNYVAIADGSAMSPTALSYYPEWFKEAIS